MITIQVDRNSLILLIRHNFRKEMLITDGDVDHYDVEIDGKKYLLCSVGNHTGQLHFNNGVLKIMSSEMLIGIYNETQL